MGRRIGGGAHETLGHVEVQLAVVQPAAAVQEHRVEQRGGHGEVGRQQLRRRNHLLDTRQLAGMTVAGLGDFRVVACKGDGRARALSGVALLYEDLHVAVGSGLVVFGGIVAASQNKITGSYASVTGGINNKASGDFASVTGGQSNEASGIFASVTGGTINTASGGWGSVTGGYQNTASGGRLILLSAVSQLIPQEEIMKLPFSPFGRLAMLILGVTALALSSSADGGCLVEFETCGQCASRHMYEAISNLDFGEVMDAQIEGWDCEIDLVHCILYAHHHDYSCGRGAV